MASANLSSAAQRPGLFARFWSSDALWRFSRNKLGVAAVIWLVLLVVASFFGPLLALEPNRVDVLARMQPPSMEHLFGTDHLGRDILARVLAGGRLSIIAAVVATTAAMAVGLLLGAVTGYRGGLLDDVLSRVFDILTTFPTLLLGILIVVVLGPSLFSVIVAIAISYVPLYGRLFRAGTLQVKNHEYVEAVIALGVSPLRIVSLHILPNIIIPILVIATGAMGRVALAESSLSFLGAGVQPPNASWGNMMSDGQPFLQYKPWIPIIPGTVLMLTTVSFSFIGDALRDAFDLRAHAGGFSEDNK